MENVKGILETFFLPAQHRSEWGPPLSHRAEDFYETCLVCRMFMAMIFLPKKHNQPQCHHTTKKIAVGL